MDKGKTGRPSASSSITSKLFSWIARILAWSLIFLVLFRCPDSADRLTPESLLVCRSYFSIRSIVKPRIQPYYESYAASYVDAARPYADTFHHNVYTPASTFAKDNYIKYAAPRVQQATALAEHQWHTTVQPRVDFIREEVGTLYGELLQPYVTHVVQVVSPTAGKIKYYVLQQYYSTIVPSYDFSLPYITYAYRQGRLFLVDIGVPYTVWASKGTASFIKTKIWPPLRIVYGQNVEPQLAKIRQRLSSYKDGKKLEAIIDEMDKDELDNASFESPMASTADKDAADLPDSSTSAEPVLNENTPTAVPEENTEDPPSGSESTDSKLNNDLKKWQVKFAKASDQGAEDLALRVADIIERQIDSQVKGVGEALVTQLEEERNQQLVGLRSIIIEAVGQLSGNPSDEDQDAAYSNILASIRSAGTSIKEKAQDLRKWKMSYARETESLVRSASDSTLDVIDGIRDLGLQEIGRRWASMEDVPYQDWVEYHNMKKTFDDWRVRVAAVAQEHQGLARARSLGEDLEDRGMSIAQEAATELARLKSVARWKIDAVDTSDDFETRPLSAAAAAIGDRIKSKIAEVKEEAQAATSSVKASVESAIPDSEDLSDSASEAAAAVKDQMSSLSEEVDNGNPFRKPQKTEQSWVESIRSVANDQIESLDKGATSIIKQEPKSTPLQQNAEEFSRRISSSVASIIASAERSAGPKAQAILSAMVSNAEKSKDAAAETAKTVASSASEAAQDAASRAAPPLENASSVIELGADALSDSIDAAGRAASSVAEEATSAASDGYTQATATVAASAGSIREDIVDGASKVSNSLKDRIEELTDAETPTVTVSVENVVSSAIDH